MVACFFPRKKKKKLLTTEMYVWKFSPYTLRLWFVREFSLLNLIMAKSCYWEKNLLSVRQVGYDKQSEFFKPLSSTLIAITISHLHSVLLYFFLILRSLKGTFFGKRFTYLLIGWALVAWFLAGKPFANKAS